MDYNNNRIHLLGKIAVTITLNGWVSPAQVSVIAEKHQMNLGRNLMGTLGLELLQKGRVMGITGEDSSDSAEGLDNLKTYFCKLYPILVTRIKKIRNA